MTETETTILAVGVALLWGAFGGVLARVALELQRRRRLSTRLLALGIQQAEGPTLQPAELARQLFLLVGRRLAERWPDEARRLQRTADTAGIATSETGASLLGMKVLLLAAGLLLGLLLYGTGGPLLVLVLLLLGWFGPNLAISRTGGQRRQRILHDLPTFLDLLSLSLEAGMGLDRAISILTERIDSPLSDEFIRVQRDISLGTPRAQALDQLAIRTRLEETRSLVTAILQAEQLGTSIVGAVQQQAKDARVSRARYAESQALQAPVRMLIPMVLFILPALFLILLGPVGLRLSVTLSGTGI